MAHWWRDRLAERPWWMNLLMGFCAYMAIFHMPWDIFMRPPAVAVEAWFGILFRGWAAKLTEPIHWAIYALGAYGFWRRRHWMWPAAAIYAAQVTFGMVVWWLFYRGGFVGVLGAVVFGGLFWAMTLALWRSKDYFHAPRRSTRERYGEWALITGASAGIGTEFARALARDGMSCVLTARREDRLRELAAELERQHGITTRVVAADLADPGGADRLADAVADLEIAVLINNAGFGYSGRFDKLETARLRDMVQVNCVAPTVLASRFLPAMRRRGRGAMIVVGSVAGRQPLPRHATYAATKAFDQLLGEALWAELLGTGVDVLVLEPGPTETEFRRVAGETPSTGAPVMGVVEVALESLGRQPSVVHGWFNWIRAAVIRFVPRSTAALAAESVVLENTPEAMR